MKVVEKEKLNPLDVKLRYLAKVVWVYRRFSKHFGNVQVCANRFEVTVKWFEPHNHLDLIHDFESITFPITSLDTRIDTYKERLSTAFKNRNNEEVVTKFKR